MSIQMEREFSSPQFAVSANEATIREDVLDNVRSMTFAVEEGRRSPFSRIIEPDRATEARVEAKLDSATISEKKVEWAENLSSAFRKASSENKPMVLLFGAEWCTACQKLKETVLNSKEFDSFADRGVFVHANPDKDDSYGNIKQKMKELGIDSFPTMVILEAPSMMERARVTGRWDKDIYLHKMNEAFKGKSDAPMPRSGSNSSGTVAERPEQPVLPSS